MPTTAPYPPGPDHATPLPVSVAGAKVSVACADGAAVPAEQLAPIEALDDTIFDALRGDPEALNRLRNAYRLAKRGVSPAVLEESREQYFRRAESVFEDSRRKPCADLGRGFAALEVLAVLQERPA